MGSTRQRGRQWEKFWGRVVCRRDTEVSEEVRRLDKTRADRTITLTALIQAARSAEVMLLHSFLTLGDSQAALAETRNREESSTTRRTSRKAIPEPGARREDSGDEERILGASSFYGAGEDPILSKKLLGDYAQTLLNAARGTLGV